MNQILPFILNHWEICLALLAVLAMIVRLEYVEHTSGVQKITPQQTTQLMNRHQAIVLDVRDKSLFDHGHILGARNIPMAELANKIDTLEQDKNKDIICICQTGQQSLNTAKLLRKHGFSKCHTLKGGLSAWRSAGLPIAQA